jgi:eukaryotic-like serine/threonine-protein kinase
VTASISAPFVPSGRYELNELLAAGGFGQVWRATDLALGRPVAVKLLHAGFACHPETLDRFRAEARHTGALSHENIARVYDYGEPPEAPAPFLVMELVEGQSLAEMLAAGPLDAAAVVDIVAQTAAGLDAAHRAGLVHRDIKPGNLLITPDGLVKITDFGISYAAGSAPVTSTGQLVGTPGYLAPERVRGARAGPSSDLYSLGVVAWECLAGRAPFTGTAVEVAIAHRDRALPLLPVTVPAEVEALISGLTAKDPAVRPATAGDLARQAGGLRDRMVAGEVLAAGAARYVPSSTIELAEPPAPEPAVDGTRRRPGARIPRRSALVATAAAAAAAAAAGLVLAGLLGHAGPHQPARLPASAPTPSAAAVTVEVSGKALIGQPVSAVVARLQKLGLKVTVRWQLSDQQLPGRVVSVSPGGLLAPGSAVTVTGALHSAGAAPAQSARPSASSPAPGSGPGSPPAAPAPSSPAPSGSGPAAPSSPPAAPDSPAPGSGGGPGPPDSPAPQNSSPAAAPPGVLALG